MIGSSGEVVEASGAEGWARIHGELWRIRAPEPVAPGQRVRVARMEGLMLEVVPESEKGA
jgi:membrane-bound serine protease (ClpP class)